MKKYLPLLFGLLLLAFALPAFADSITLGNTTNIHGNHTIRGTDFVINISSDNNITGCSILAFDISTNSSGSSNLTFGMAQSNEVSGLIIGNFTLPVGAGNIGVAGNSSNLSARVNTLSLQDHNAYNISAVCVHLNGTRIFIPFANTSVIVDNTAPTAPSSLTTGIFNNKTFSLQSTVNNALTTACTLIFTSTSPISGNTPTATNAINTTSCRAAIENANFGSYEYRMVASDGTNESSSSTSSFTIKSRNNGGLAQVTTQQALVQAQTQQVQRAGNKVIFVGAIMGFLFILIVVGAYFVVLKGK